MLLRRELADTALLEAVALLKFREFLMISRYLGSAFSVICFASRAVQPGTETRCSRNDLRYSSHMPGGIPMYFILYPI